MVAEFPQVFVGSIMDCIVYKNKFDDTELIAEFAKIYVHPDCHTKFSKASWAVRRYKLQGPAPNQYKVSSQQPCPSSPPATAAKPPS